MSGHRLLAFFRRVAQEIRRDHRSVALLFVVPIVMTGLITFIVREGETPVVNAAVVNDAGPAGIGATAALDAALADDGGSAEVVAGRGRARARPSRTRPSRSSSSCRPASAPPTPGP